MGEIPHLLHLVGQHATNYYLYMSEENTPTPTVDTPVESVPEIVAPVKPEEETTSVSEVKAKDATEAEDEKPNIEPVVEKSVNENITIIKTPETVTITEVMPASTSPLESSYGEAKPAYAQGYVEAKQKTLWRNLLEKIQIGKKRKLEKIMNMVDKKIKITNDDVEKTLRVSDATARRYLDILEKEGKLQQVGKAGKYTHYIKI